MPNPPLPGKPTASDKKRGFFGLAIVIAFVVLVILGFVVRPGGVSLWSKFGQVVSGKTPEGGGRVSQNYLDELKQMDEYIENMKTELPSYAEHAKHEEKGKLLAGQDLIQTACKAMEGTMATCDRSVQALKEGKFDRPTAADFDVRKKKLAGLLESYKGLLAEIDKKLK